MSARQHAPRAAWTLSALASVAIVAVMSLSGCGASPATATGTPCSAQPTTTAVVWDANGQVHGSLDGMPPVTLSAFSYPLGLPGESSDSPVRLGALSVAPDAHHVAVQALVPSTGDLGHSYPYIVDLATHAVTRVALPRYPLSLGQTGRPFAWADAHTLIVFAGVGGSGASANDPLGPATYSYNLATGAVTALPGMSDAVEGIIRCSTVFWLGLTSLTAIGSYNFATFYRGQVQLYRYNFATHKEIGQPLALGDTTANDGGPWGLDWPGWDVSAGGTQVVYQQMQIAFDGVHDVITSTFRESNADGSNPRILFAGPRTVMLAGAARLGISPDGRQVAMTASPSDPAVSGTFAGSGDFKSYSPSGVGQPVWLPDGSGFLATASADPSFTAGIYQYWPGTPALGHDGTIPGVQLSQGGTNPATLV